MDYENSDRNNEWEKVRAEVLHELRADESSRLEPQGINYTAFISMTTSTALLSARVSDCFVNDAKRIMSLLGKAYGLAETESERYIDSILGVMMCIASPKDYKTFQALRGGDNVLDCEDVLFDIKGSVLDGIMASRARGLYVSPAGNGEMQRVAYNARMSCIKLCDIAATGDVLCSRQVSIMRYLGIGCEKNVERAINGFIECAYWGDATSVKLLHACLCEQNMDVSIIRDYEAIASRYWYDTPLLPPVTPCSVIHRNPSPCIVRLRLSAAILFAAEACTISTEDLLRCCETRGFQTLIRRNSSITMLRVFGAALQAWQSLIQTGLSDFRRL